jgi:hypothetical protein
MTDLDLDAIEARVNAAADGPWVAERGARPTQWPKDYVARPLRNRFRVGDEADAEFIAHARTDVPALVAEVRRLREFMADPLTQEFVECLREEFRLRHGAATEAHTSQVEP